MQAASADTALQTWLQWLENSGAAVTMRESAWLYPIVETVHIVGFVVVVGAASMFDLRLLGAPRGLPVTETARHLLPWSRAGLLAVVPVGAFVVYKQRDCFVDQPCLQAKAGAARRCGC